MPYKDPEMQKAYQRQWIAERRARWFRNKKCARCESTDNLELDHIDQNNKWTHRIWSYSWKKIMEETAKCQVLCHDCHWTKTRDEDMQYKGLVHGTLNGYKYHGCRCAACRKANVDSVNEWRWRTGRRKKRSAYAPVYAKGYEATPEGLQNFDKNLMTV